MPWQLNDLTASWPHAGTDGGPDQDQEVLPLEPGPAVARRRGLRAARVLASLGRRAPDPASLPAYRAARLRQARWAGRKRAAAAVDRQGPGRWDRGDLVAAVRVQGGCVVDQREAAELVEREVLSERWTGPHAERVRVILACLVRAMDWEHGLVQGVTRASMAAAAGCSERTVSRTLAWAAAAGLVLVVEEGASGDWLRTSTGRGRTPTYAIIDPKTQVRDLNYNIVTLPTGSAEEKNPHPNRGQEQSPDRTPKPRRTALRGLWPLYGAPTDSITRTRARNRLLERLGRPHGRLSRRQRTQVSGMLASWWDAGMCPAGILHALDRHPDRPGVARGDAVSGARDLAAVLGARLGPWRGRLHELPTVVWGRPVLAEGHDPASGQRTVRYGLPITPRTGARADIDDTGGTGSESDRCAVDLGPDRTSDRGPGSGPEFPGPRGQSAVRGARSGPGPDRGTDHCGGARSVPVRCPGLGPVPVRSRRDAGARSVRGEAGMAVERPARARQRGTCPSVEPGRRRACRPGRGVRPRRGLIGRPGPAWGIQWVVGRCRRFW